MNAEITKALKMFGRMIIVSTLPVVILGIQNGQPLRTIGLGVLLAILMAINTYVNASPNIDSKGILPLV